MAIDNDEADATLPPDDAFAVLGNETRMEILQTLGEADGALSFSELRDRVGVRDSGQFNYHLKKLEGHFVDKTDDGYVLRRPGGRVIEAVLSGAVTDIPVLELTDVDGQCGLCDAPIKMSYRGESVRLYCTECAGNYDASATRTVDVSEDLDSPDEYGFIGREVLPAAGIKRRTPSEALDAADTWAGTEWLRAVNGVCPRCSAVIEESVRICEDHDSTDGICDQCGYRHPVMLDLNCTNCIYEEQAPFPLKFLANTEALAFMTSHGINPVGDSPKDLSSVEWGREVEILGVKPFEARYTITIDGDTLSLTVDDDLSVVEATNN